MNASETNTALSLQMFAEAASGESASGKGAAGDGGEQAPTAAQETGDSAPQSAAMQTDGGKETEAPAQTEAGDGQAPTAAPNGDADGGEPGMGRLLYAMRLQLAQREKRARAAAVLEGWEKEAEELKKTYPAFSLKAALREGGDFAALLKAGVPLRRAYETAHLEEIMYTAMRYAAKQAGRYAAGALRDQQARPQENPVRQRASTKPGTDVNSLTQGDILRILGEVSRGAKITFR